MSLFTSISNEGCTCYGPLSDDDLKAIISIVAKIIAIEKRKSV